jgi:hypothetical protein
MVWVWHKPGDLDCSLCEAKPSLKKLKGCPPYERAEVPHMYPPGRISDYPGKRVEVDRCPVTFVSPDLSLVARYARVGIPFDKLDSMPPPMIDAVEFYETQMTLRDNLKVKEAYKSNA